MANLAIKGHPTRGKEVIKILEMLGGVNKYEIPTAKEDLLYTIRSHDKFIIAVSPTNTFVVFTIEEFLEKFPYKVGDKALFYGDPVFITKIEWIEWIEDSVAYHFYYNGRELIAPAKHLQPYKEETMEEIKIDIPKGYEFARVDDDNQQVVFE